MTSTTWLLRDGAVLANAEIAGTYAERMRGLLGRAAYEGGLVLPHTRSVHTMGMRFAIDVAFLDLRLGREQGLELLPRLLRLAPGQIGRASCRERVYGLV